MGYHQQQLRILGRLVASYDKRNLDDLLDRYRDGLEHALRRAPRIPSLVNVLQHAYGYFAQELTRPEKAHFQRMLDDFRTGKIPLSVPVGLLNSWIARFGQDYLSQQMFFQPYPEELVLLADSGKGMRI
jgi:uncharacterized protein YbgA (DUF1722 family)